MGGRLPNARATRKRYGDQKMSVAPPLARKTDYVANRAPQPLQNCDPCARGAPQLVQNPVAWFATGAAGGGR
jgi:hypothetical protein